MDPHESCLGTLTCSFEDQFRKEGKRTDFSLPYFLVKSVPGKSRMVSRNTLNLDE